MRIRQRVTLLFVSLILCLPSVALADPQVMSPAPFFLAPLFLVLEGIIIVFLAKRSAPYRIRFITLWFFVTLITFLCLLLWSRMSKTPISFPAFLFAEILITIVEAAAIYYMLRWSFLARNLATPPSFSRALIYSVIANIV